MKQRYFIYFSYDGTAYHGWQIQPNANSVQAEMQRAMSLLLRHPVELVGAGRTDTGVHARTMVAHFDVDTPIDAVQLTYKLNRVLPFDITINAIKAVDADMHARFSATKRTYHYYIHLDRDPFCRAYSYALHQAPDFQLMNEAAEILLSHKDFGAFCKSHSDAKTTLCEVYEARWIKLSDTKWHFRISANRFLRNMVRAIVGTLLDVGWHKITLEQFVDILHSKSRQQAGESVPGHALFLEDVQY